MSVREGVRVAVLGLWVLAAWELGQIAATYLIYAVYEDHFQLAFAPANGADQLDVLAILAVRTAIAALVALPLVFLVVRLVLARGGRSRDGR